MDKKNYSYALRWAKKIKAIDMLGGKCTNCNESRFFCLDFHHNRDKTDNVNKLFGMRWSVLENEIKKCRLLCSNCHAEFHSGNTRCKDLKIKFLEFKNAYCCQKCGYSGKSYASLDFHHRNSENKDFNIGNAFRFITTMREKIELELEKCDVLCRNCHAELHFDINRFNAMEQIIRERIVKYIEHKVADRDKIKELNKNGITNNEICEKLKLPKSTVSTAIAKMGLRCAVSEYRKSLRNGIPKICPSCKKEFLCFLEDDVDHKTYCSLDCKHKGAIKLTLTKEEMIELLKTETYSSLSRKYNVAPNTVRNLAKRYGLIG